MIITLSGEPCTGKSYVVDKLAQHYKLKKFSVGDFRRQAAHERGLSISEYNALEEDTDTPADKRTIELGNTEKNSRRQWYVFKYLFN